MSSSKPSKGMVLFEEEELRRGEEDPEDIISEGDSGDRSAEVDEAS